MTGRLPAVNARRLIRALKRAGFVVERVSGSHYLPVDPTDPTRAVTVPYHGTRDLKAGTLRSIPRQAGLGPDDLARLLRVAMLAPTVRSGSVCS